MGYFNPISYFIKSFIRIFTKKFFWFILIGICLFLGFILFNNNGVFGATYTTEQIISNNMYYLVATLVGQGNLPNTDPSSYKYLITSNGEVIITKANGDLFVNIYNRGKFSLGGCYYISTSSLYDASTTFNCVWDKWNSSDAGGEAFANLNTTTIYSSFGYMNTPTLVFQLPFTNPFIVNDTNSIVNWSFDYLNINGGSTPFGYIEDNELVYENDFILRYTYNGTTYEQELTKNYFSWDLTTNTYAISIDRNSLFQNLVIRDGSSINFTLVIEGYDDGTYDLGSYTISLTSTEQEEINQDSDKQLQADILDQQKITNDKLDTLDETQKQTNNKLDTLDNTINDSSVDDITSDTLPTDSTTDITSEGVNGIFTSIYNAFCTGQAQDIVFPIPFTDKNITLQANYVSSMLTSSGATWVITIIQAFWWYIISRFIIKDIMNKINKIKSGNIEQIETTNIRGDML